ncbi:MAG TPA: hypothetical protein ENG65_00920, partial [Candidatus Bathyarchaeota archaeon]|nr:hypothetical protein [Candidatus Bathyarchaeota archaeon]
EGRREWKGVAMMISNVNASSSSGSYLELTSRKSRFISALKQSFLALSLDLGGLLAGSILLLFSNVFSVAPWFIMIYPSIISMRGVIGGFFSGRLSTALHLGTIRPSLLNNTRDFKILIFSVIILTVLSSITTGLLAFLINISLWRTSIIDSLGIFSAVITTMGLSLIFVSPVTIGISIMSFKYGLDPDIIVYPVMSTIGDILTTLCFVFSMNLLINPIGPLLTGIFDLAYILIAAFLVVRHGRSRELSRTIREFLLTLIIVTLIVNLTGGLLRGISGLIKGRSEIYVLYPALMDMVGDIGSIIGSITTTRLALGTIDSSLRSIQDSLPEMGGALLSSTIWFMLFSPLALYLAYGGIILNDLFTLMLMLMSLNILAAPVISTLSYSLAVFTFQRGLDPDNFVIPCESTLSDSITTACLLIVITLFTW